VLYIPTFQAENTAKTERNVRTARASNVELVGLRPEPRRESAPVPPPKTSVKTVKEDSKTYHIVRKGERLTDISERYGVDVATLKGINRLKKDQIYPNMRIQLVSQKKKQEPRAATGYHTVKKGENLVDISEKYGVDMVTLKRVNKLKNDRIMAGTRLRLPPKKG